MPAIRLELRFGKLSFMQSIAYWDKQLELHYPGSGLFSLPSLRSNEYDEDVILMITLEIEQKGFLRKLFQSPTPTGLGQIDDIYRVPALWLTCKHDFWGDEMGGPFLAAVWNLLSRLHPNRLTLTLTDTMAQKFLEFLDKTACSNWSVLFRTKYQGLRSIQLHGIQPFHDCFFEVDSVNLLFDS